MARNEDAAARRVTREPLALSRALWVITVAAGVATLVAAYYGWVLELRPDSVMEWIEAGVRTVYVFFLSDIYFDKVSDAARPFIEWARALGAMVTLLLAGRLVIAAFGSWFARLWLSGRRGHDLVIGAGPAAKAYVDLPLRKKLTHLADGFQPMLGRSATLARQGTLLKQLKTANAKACRRILVDEGDDASTWQTAQAAASACRKKEVIAYIRDPWLLERLSRAEVDANLLPFSYAGGVARQVMLAHPPYLLARQRKASGQHILLVGFGAVGQALLREFLVTSVSNDPAPMMVTVVDPGIERLHRDFLARHPALLEQIDIRFLAGDLRLDDDGLLEAIRARTEKAPICAAYVAVDDRSMPMSQGVALKDRAERLTLFSAPIFLCAEHGAGLPEVRQGAGLVGAAASDREETDVESLAKSDSLLCDLRLVSFGSWRNALDGAGLLEPALDRQARRVHEAYLKLTGSLSGQSNSAPSAAERPWESLSDEFRVSNRRAAAHIRAKADAAGFQLDKWLQEKKEGRLSHELPPAGDLFDLDNRDLVRVLSMLEHRRWILDRLLNGWRRGPVKDVKARTQPLIKPFDELDPVEISKDETVIATTRAILLDGQHKRQRVKRAG